MAKTIQITSSPMPVGSTTKDWERRIMHHLANVAWVEVPGGRVEYLALGTEQLTGFAHAEVQEGGFNWLLDRVRRRDAAVHRRAYEQLLRDGGTWEADFRFRRAEGTWIWLHGRVSKPISDNDRGLVYVTLADISKRKGTEEKLRKAKRAAEAVSKHKRELMALVSHEIRTPMTGILGYTGMLASEDATDADRARWTRIIDLNSRRLMSLVDGMLDLSKLEAEKIDLDLEPFDAGRLVEDVAALVAPLATEKGLKLEISRGDGLPHSVRGDVARVRQIIVNLVGNAVKFTPSGSVTIALALTRNDIRDELHFTVTDTGPGIDADDERRMYEPFRRGSSNQIAQVEGAGLGLTICRRLARLMNGEITYRNAAGGGSVFTFVMPLLDDIEQATLHAA